MMPQRGRKRGYAAVASAMARYGPAAVRAGYNLTRRVKRARTASTVNYQAVSRSRLGSRQERDQANGFVTGQYTKYKFRLGKKRSPVAALNKLDRRDAVYVVERIGAVNRFTSATGAYALTFATDVTDPANPRTQCPLYALDLTSRSKVAASGGVSSNINPFHRMRIENNSNDITFFPVATRTNTGGTNTRNDTGDWNVLKVSGSTTSATQTTTSSAIFRAPAAVLEWTRCKFLFTAPTSRPGYVKIQMVQFHEGAMVPNGSYPSIVTSGVGTAAEYTNYIKPLLFNPIIGGNSNNYKPPHMRVLKTWVKTFSPDTTINKDPTGQKIRMDIFLRHNRYCQFRAMFAEPLLDPEEQLDAAVFPDRIDSDVITNYVGDPKARIFLLVTGTHYDDKDDVKGVETSITFDMDVSHKYIMRGGNGPASGPL